MTPSTNNQYEYEESGVAAPVGENRVVTPVPKVTRRIQPKRAATKTHADRLKENKKPLILASLELGEGGTLQVVTFAHLQPQLSNNASNFHTYA